MFISDGVAYLPFRCPTNEYMDSYPKVILTPAGDWKLQDLDDEGQWKYSDDNLSSGVNVSTTSYTQYNYVLETIL